MRARGVALISVLWIVGLLSILAITALSMVRSRTHQTAALKQSLQELHARQAITAQTIALLVDHDVRRRPRTDGTSFEVSVAGANGSVTIENERGRIDLNRATDALIVAALEGNGISQTNAERFRDTLRDWQDTDNIPRSAGAEAPDYRRAGLTYGPRNGALESTDEVLQLLWADRIPLRCFLSAFTVYSGTADVNVRAAGPLVQHSLAWLNRSLLKDSAGSLPPSAAPDSSSEAGNVLRLIVRIKRDDAAAIPHEQVIRLTGDPAQPAQILLDSPASTADDSIATCANRAPEHQHRE